VSLTSLLNVRELELHHSVVNLSETADFDEALATKNYCTQTVCSLLLPSNSTVIVVVLPITEALQTYSSGLTAKSHQTLNVTCKLNRLHSFIAASIYLHGGA